MKYDFNKGLIKMATGIWLLLFSWVAQSQTTNTNGGNLAGFGINAVIYSNETFTTGTTIPPAGRVDWFKKDGNTTGRNIIKQDAGTITTINTLLSGATLNPVYSVRMDGALSSDVDVEGASKISLIDAVWGRDHFGGTGAVDQTAFAVSSKNAQDPAIWGTGPTNVLGKNDLVDIGGHMFRKIDGTANDLYFVGLINRAEPGGASYMDFEFFIKEIIYNSTTHKFNSGGPDMGHTAFRFNPNGSIKSLGDILFNVALTDGGSKPGIEIRVWVNRTDYNTMRANPAAYPGLPFAFGPYFDGAGTNSPFGYASITPKTETQEVVGFVNLAGQIAEAPPWGTKNTKANVFTTNYIAYSVAEVGMNMTALGLDNLGVEGIDPCNFPWQTFMVKTRSSASFTAALKDFAGPYKWGQPSVEIGTSTETLSCANPVATLTADPVRNDVTYHWYTENGNIIGATNGSSIQADKPGAYYVDMTLPTGCKFTSDPINLVFAGTPISDVTLTSNISCFGADNGSISLSLSGGTPNYTYSWDNNAIAQVTTNSTTLQYTSLAPGTYTVTVTDNNSCSMVRSIEVQESPQIVATATVTPVACFGASNGAITLTSVTGATPFTYSWTNGKTTKDLLNVPAGSYTVTITDANGCAAEFGYTVTQPAAALAATLTKVNDTDADPEVGNGTINLTVTGGATPYNYSWSGPGTYSSTSEDISNLQYGSYSVTITDANGCTLVQQTFIYEPEICFDGIDNDGDGLTDCADPDCEVPLPVISTFSGDPCVGDNIQYSVSNTGDYVSPYKDFSYFWTVPANAEISAGGGTATITAKWNTTVPGQVCVTVVSSKESMYPGKQCTSKTSCVLVSPSDAPSTPTAIIKE